MQKHISGTMYPREMKTFVCNVTGHPKANNSTSSSVFLPTIYVYKICLSIGKKSLESDYFANYP